MPIDLIISPELEVAKSIERQLKAPGAYEEKWTVANKNNQLLSSGIYFYNLSSGGKSITKKMVLSK